jgi:hypothetical protein
MDDMENVMTDNKTFAKMGALSISMLCIIAAACHADPEFTPIGEANFDFGKVKQGVKVTHTFQFKNTGTDTLLIHDVRSSCGCTAALVSKSRIAPGMLGEISTTFNTAGRTSRQKKSINVQTNDPGKQSFVFTLQGNIFVSYELKPTYLRFKAIKPGESSNAEVTLVNRTEKTITLGTPQTPREDLAVELDKTELKPGESTIVSGTFKPAANQSALTGSVTIPVLTDGEEPIKLRVYGRIIKS